MKDLFSKLILDVFADSGQKFADSSRHDPYRNFNFRVTITGKKVFAKAGFQKVSGLKLKTDVIEYRDGADAQLNPHKLAGLVKFDPVTFERGMSEDGDMFDWIYMQIKNNDAGFKCSVRIELLDRNRVGVKTWEIREAWVSDYETGDLDAQGSGIFVERMTVQHEGIKLLKGTSKGIPVGTLER